MCTVGEDCASCFFRGRPFIGLIAIGANASDVDSLDDRGRSANGHITICVDLFDDIWSSLPGLKFARVELEDGNALADGVVVLTAPDVLTYVVPIHNVLSFLVYKV